ncbi:hypothetical protein [Dactylosporangium salmoneum]|uniref:hypothetical protein n=1 Tax=Dactylosporangium salmoneum TaxID=53361 RepID=UPI0031E44355
MSAFVQGVRRRHDGAPIADGDGPEQDGYRYFRLQRDAGGYLDVDIVVDGESVAAEVTAVADETGAPSLDGVDMVATLIMSGADERVLRACWLTLQDDLAGIGWDETGGFATTLD